MIRDTTVTAKLWAAAVWAVTGFFVLNLLAMIATVVTSSFATRWLGTWFPAGWTTRWTSYPRSSIRRDVSCPHPRA
jgi:putative spermidine/putrescine transport system permease protein